MISGGRHRAVAKPSGGQDHANDPCHPVNGLELPFLAYLSFRLKRPLKSMSLLFMFRNIDLTGTERLGQVFDFRVVLTRLGLIFVRPRW